MVRNLMIQPYFDVIYRLLEGGKLQNIEDPSVVIHDYQLLFPTTNKIMDDNKDIYGSGIFWGVLLIVGCGKLLNIGRPLLVGLGYELLPLATSQNMENFNHIFMYFEIEFSSCMRATEGKLFTP